MNTAPRRSAVATSQATRNDWAKTERPGGHAPTCVKARVRVYVAAENRLMREALSRMLMKRGEIDVEGLNSEGRLRPENLIEEQADILRLTSRGSAVEDVVIIRQARLTSPTVRVLLAGMTEETEFFQYGSAGISGYLPKDASAEDVLEAIEALHEGEAVCPGPLCALLFQYFEREATCLPSGKIQDKLGLTRREQQILPLIAQGKTNKEIANHFCLSEQTIKNHLYRMKHKVGADDTLEVVHLCRSQGFLV
jgi:DNA-binding NarL/FixJ family response regulator